MITYLSVGMFVLYPCNSSTLQDGDYTEILTKFEINAYTRDKTFDPIVLYFYKHCINIAPPGNDFVL